MNTSVLDRFLDEMPSRGIPSCELTVTVDGETAYRRQVAMPDPKRNICFVCSVSKVTTCVAAMRMVEEGKIGLDDPVWKYLPAFRNLTVRQPDGSVRRAENELTVRHLFTMTGGLNYNLKTAPILRATADRKATTLEVVNSFAESPLDFEPGAKFQYSLCHDVLAAVVETASGMRFADYVAKYVLDPLGMTDTGYHFPEELTSRLEPQYRYAHGLFRCEEIKPVNQYVLTDNYDSGGAGLYTTADDQIKLLTALACGGKAPNGYRLLKPETIAMMEVGQLSDEIRKRFYTDRLYGYSWGLCGRVHVDPAVSCSESSVGEFGWDGATGPYALVDRKKHLALYFGVHIYGCNYLYNQIHPMLRDMVYRTLF